MISIRTGKSVVPAIISIMLVAFMAPCEVAAQGESAVPFLLIAPNARADGMGEAGAALSDDGSASYWNPGGLAFETGQEISITHSNWLPQFQLSDLLCIPEAYGGQTSEHIYVCMAIEEVQPGCASALPLLFKLKPWERSRS